LGYSNLKEKIYLEFLNYFKLPREKYKKMKNKEVEKILKEGAKKANKITKENLEKILKITGLR